MGSYLLASLPVERVAARWGIRGGGRRGIAAVGRGGATVGRGGGGGRGRGAQVGIRVRGLRRVVLGGRGV